MRVRQAQEFRVCVTVHDPRALHRSVPREVEEIQKGGGGNFAIQASGYDEGEGKYSVRVGPG